MKRYTHSVNIHNLSAPKEIVPVVIELINPKSVVDIGCGLGTFLKVFKDYGVQEIYGIDGPWCNKPLLFENIDPNEFSEQNIEASLYLNKKYDLAICLEVAEHLSPKRAESFIDDLTKISDVILFSAAVPSQGGDHHINEQWLTYWRLLFEKNDYIIRDVLRPIFWNNKNVFWWYKQNMVLVTKVSYNNEKILLSTNNIIENIIHPELYSIMIDSKEKNAWKRHSRRLLKSILYKFKSF